MINLLLGAPGGGKGYEACVYHILVALEKGRKVITNMPLDLDRWRDLHPDYPGLIEIRTKAVPVGGTWDPLRESGAFGVGELPEEDEASKGFAPSGFIGRTFLPRPKPRISGRAFAGVWCYHTEWRHPVHGFGPLFVIDEAHLCLPKIGTDPAVLEWFSLHRHFNADVLLMTQSYGKIAQDVRDLVQLCYRVRKNVALGSTKTYTRKVQDGIRGEVVNENQRRYDRRYFGLWKSHTQGVAASEFNASDVTPIWRHWSFIGAGLCALVVVGMFGSGRARAPWAIGSTPRPAQSASSAVQPPLAPVVYAASSPVQLDAPQQPASSAGIVSSVASALSSPAPAASDAQGRPEPFVGHGLHLVGTVQAGRQVRYLLVLSQSGQPLQTITDQDLRHAGYTWEARGRCVAWATWGSHTRAVVCDAPAIGAQVPGAKAAGVSPGT